MNALIRELAPVRRHGRFFVETLNTLLAIPGFSACDPLPSFSSDEPQTIFSRILHRPSESLHRIMFP